MRIGAKKRPFYRVVAVNEQAKRTGGYIELLGTYNPLTSPKEIILKQDRVDHWVKQGAQMTNGFLRIIGKAKQRLPQKPKKEKKEKTPVPSAPVENKAQPQDDIKTEPVAEKQESVTQEQIKTDEADTKEESKEKTNEGSA